MLVTLFAISATAWAQDDPNNVELKPVTGQTNQWTMTMPAANVTLNVEYEPEFTATFKALTANTIGTAATVKLDNVAIDTLSAEKNKLNGIYEGQTITLTAQTGYKFRSVTATKGGGEPVLLTTITAAYNSSFKSGSQTFGDVATVTLTGDWLRNDGSHGGWYCQGENLTATISVAEANGANITSVKFYTAGGGSAEDKDAPFEVTTTTVTSSNITTYLNGNSIGSYGVSKIEVYGTK